MSNVKPIRICFVCMGNICRSPLAECVFRHKVKERGVEAQFQIDSAGTGGWHAGDPPDARVRHVATTHGVTVAGQARQIKAADFAEFDLFLCMDDENLQHLLGLGVPPDKLRLLLSVDPDAGRRDVPDPYYGGADGFELVYQLVDSACDALLEELLTTRR